eukprot:PhF_6_TR26721/c1_g1_i1/m.39125
MAVKRFENAMTALNPAAPLKKIGTHTKVAFKFVGMTTAHLLKIDKLLKPNQSGDMASNHSEIEVLPDEDYDPEAEKEVYSSISPPFFTKEFRAEMFELDRAISSQNPDDLKAAKEEEEYFDVVIRERKDQLAIVDRRLQRKISMHYNDIVEGVMQIGHVNSGLGETIRACEKGRQKLAAVKTSAVMRGMEVTQLHRRRQHLISVLKVVDQIKSLTDREVKFHQHVKNAEFLEAIELCKTVDLTGSIREVIAAAPLIQSWHIRKTDPTSLLTKVDEALVVCCVRLDVRQYEACLRAFLELGDRKNAGPRLIHSLKIVSESIVAKTMQTFVPKGGRTIELLCKNIPQDDVLNCMTAVVSQCALLANNYYLMLQWHEARSTIADGFTEYLNEIRQVLASHCKELCSTLQGNILECLRGFAVQTNKPDHVLRCSLMAHMFIQMCTALGHGQSAGNEVKDIARKFTRAFIHKPRMESLSTMMGREGLHALTGLHFSSVVRHPGVVSFDSFNAIVDKSKEFVRNKIIPPPEPSFVKECHGYTSLAAPTKQAHRTHEDEGFVVIMTSLELCKQMFKYVEDVVSLYPVLASEVLEMLREHAASFFYYVFSNMCIVSPAERTFSSYVAEDDPEIPLELRNAMKELKTCALRTLSDSSMSSHPTFPPVLTQELTLTMKSAKDIFAAPQRVTALQAVDVVIKQFDMTIQACSTVMTGPHKQTYCEAVAKLQKCNLLMFRVCSKRLSAALIPMDLHITNIAEKLKWDIKSFGMLTEASPYTKIIIDTVKTIADRFKVYQNDFPDVTSKNQLLRSLVLHVFASLVEGYSRPKKCTEQGRSLMQKDVTEIHNALSAALGTNIVPNADCVLQFLITFTMTEQDAINWISEWHHMFTTPQLTAILLYGTKMSTSKDRQQQMLTALKDLLKRVGHQEQTLFEALS